MIFRPFKRVLDRIDEIVTQLQRLKTDSSSVSSSKPDLFSPKTDEPNVYNSTDSNLEEKNEGPED